MSEGYRDEGGDGQSLFDSVAEITRFIGGKKRLLAIATAAIVGGGFGAYQAAIGNAQAQAERMKRADEADFVRFCTTRSSDGAREFLRCPPETYTRYAER